MAKPLTIAQMDARYEALEEASQHLRMNWTDVETEINEGMVMADWLHSQALKWLAKAQDARAALAP